MTKHTPVRQNALTVVLPIRGGHAPALRAMFVALRNADGGLARNADLPFAELRTVHFARFVVVEQSLRAQGDLRSLDPAVLVYSSNYDGDLDDHLRELVAAAGSWLHSVLCHCVAYDAPTVRPDFMQEFLERHTAPYGAFHVGAVGLSVGQIEDEEALRVEIQSFLDERPDVRSEADPAAIRESIRAHLATTDSAWALARQRRPSVLGTLPAGSVGRAVGMGARILLALLPSPFIAFGLRRREKADPVFPRTWYDQRAQELAAREDKIVQNQMTILADVKDGWLRSYLLRTVLVSINTLGRVLFRKGRLGSIGTIHFARWVVIDRGRALLFFSNYTGSWEQYLGDFVDRASVGLTAVWSNTVLYPRTRWLVLDGARDEERFKAWVRAQQMETDLWYSAYRNLSMANILNNHAIRMGLTGTLSPAETRAWLRRL